MKTQEKLENPPSPTQDEWKRRYVLLEQMYREALNELVQMRAWEENCSQFRWMYVQSEQRCKQLSEDNKRLRAIIEPEMAKL